MKFEIGEKVLFLGEMDSSKTHSYYRETAIVLKSAYVYKMEVYTLLFIDGYESVSTTPWLEKIKEKEMNIEIDKSTLICHPFDDRTYDLIGKKVYAFEDIFEKPVVGVLQHAVYNLQRIPFRVVGDDIDKLFSFIAPYVEPVKQYRPYMNDELQSLLGIRVCKKGNYRAVRRIASYIQDETGWAYIELHDGERQDAKDLFDDWVFIDGSFCGVKI